MGENGLQVGLEGKEWRFGFESGSGSHWDAVIAFCGFSCSIPLCRGVSVCLEYYDEIAPCNGLQWCLTIVVLTSSQCGGRNDVFSI